MADSPNRILGRATINLNGKIISSKPGAELDASQGERQVELDENGVAGFSEKSKAATLKVDVWAKPGITSAALYAMMDCTVLFEGDNGYKCTLALATTLKVGGIKTGSGGATYNVEMFGMVANESQS